MKNHISGWVGPLPKPEISRLRLQTGSHVINMLLKEYDIKITLIKDINIGGGEKKRYQARKKG